MDEEGDATRTEFLDEEMGEEIIVARKVLNFHNFGRAPFCPGRFLVSGEDMGMNGHLGWQEGGGRERGRDGSGKERIRKSKFVEMRGHDAARDAHVTSSHPIPSPTRHESTKRAVSFSSSSHKAVQSIRATFSPSPRHHHRHGRIQ
jgi:hypothetical protein